MHHWMKRLQKDQKGLTLIELIVVVAIIGVLAWLITPRVLDALGTSKTASADNFANEVLAAMERYAGDPSKGNGLYPPAITSGIHFTSLKTTLNLMSSKTDGFLAAASGDTIPANYVTNAGRTAYCLKLAGADTTLDRWVSPSGVSSTAPTVTGVTCPS